MTPLQIGWHEGPRSELRVLFEEAEDSAEQLNAYFELGTVLVASRGGPPIGHLQLVPTPRAGVVELKSLAVIDAERGQGLGRQLVEEAVRRAAAAGNTEMIVSTAAASIGNLRFYQRVGFRLVGVDRDAFTPDTGYPDPIFIDGIELRDRVWFNRTLTGVANQP